MTLSSSWFWGRQCGQTLVGALVAILGLALLPRAVQAQSFTQSFSYTGGYQSFVVPVGVTSLTVKLWGAGGGSAGGSGAFVTGNLAVTPGTSLTLLVGGGGGYGNFSQPRTFGGGGGTNDLSGSGGGRSAIRRSTNNAVVSDELVTAAGGAGGSIGAIDVGGGGGLSTGQRGTDNTFGFGAGGGATQTSGGAAGNFANYYFGYAGSRFQGGDSSGSGGAGGGGYFGGGGGTQYGGGGGGSSYFSNPSFTYNSAASQAGALGNANGVLPGGANDLAYLAGIAVGGAANSPGGNGYILISYTVTPEPGSLVFLVLGSTLILIKRRKAVHA